MSNTPYYLWIWENDDGSYDWNATSDSSGRTLVKGEYGTDWTLDQLNQLLAKDNRYIVRCIMPDGWPETAQEPIGLSETT